MAVGLHEMLTRARSADATVRKAAEEQLSAAEQSSLPSFMLALIHELAAEDKAIDARQLAGLQMKNLLTARDDALREQKEQRWLTELDAGTRSQVKAASMAALRSAQHLVAAQAAQVVARIGAIELSATDGRAAESCWPELTGELLANMKQGSPHTQVATLQALGYMCDDLEPDQVKKETTDSILTIVIDALKDTRPEELRAAAAEALNTSLAFTADNFEAPAERDMIMAQMMAATASPSVSTRKAAFQCLAQVATMYYQHIATYMTQIFEITLKAIQQDEEEVALMAIEFWSTICDEELEVLETWEPAQCFKYIAQAAPTLVPVLLSGTLTKQDEELDEKDDWGISQAGSVCLGLVASTVAYTDDTAAGDNEALRNQAGKSVVDIVLAFVQANIVSPQWNLREAALMAFALALDGPPTALLMGPVQTVIPVLINAASDAHPKVKDTAAYTLSRICEAHPTTIDATNFQPVLMSLMQSLDSTPNVAAFAAGAIHYLAMAENEETGEKLLAQPMQPILQQLLQKLLQVTERPDWKNSNLRLSAYEAINVLIDQQKEDPTAQQMISQLLPMIKHRLQASFQVPVLSQDDKNDRDGLQICLCSVLGYIIRALTLDGDGKSTCPLFVPHADEVMQLLLMVVSNSSGTAVEEGLLTIGLVADAIGKDFARFMPAFYPHLGKCLMNKEEWQVCGTAVRATGDLCRALEGDVATYTNEIVGVLLQNLNAQDLRKDVKPDIFSCFGDIAMAVQGGFDVYLGPVMEMIGSAGDLCRELPVDDDEELMDYKVLLRSGLLEAYTGIVSGLEDGQKIQLIMPHGQKILEFLQDLHNDHRGKKIEAGHDTVRNAVALIGDLAKGLGAQVRPLAAAPFVAELLADCASMTDDEQLTGMVNYARREVQAVMGV